MALTDEQLDSFLKAASESGLSEYELSARMHERRRKNAHALAKQGQRNLGLRGSTGHDAILAHLKAAWDAPLTAEDKSAAQGDIEYLILTIQDCLNAGDLEDFIFANMRLSRKLLGRNSHLWRTQDLLLVDDPSVAAATQKSA